jgi:hypothetical protein
MSERCTSDTNENILNEFVEYWDKWHKEWYKKCSKKIPKPDLQIKGWNVPEKEIDYSGTIDLNRGNGKKKNFSSEKIHVYKAIPEPYWIHKDIIANRIELHAVFMNINPGPSKFYHLNSNTKVPNTGTRLLTKYRGENKNNEINPAIDWFAEYTESVQTYSKFISSLIDIYGDTVTNENYGKFWHNKNRVDWLKEHPKINKSSLKNIATFELIPWHTNNVSEIKSDWYYNDSIEEDILKPAIHLCKSASDVFQNKIISRGKRDKWNDVFENINKKSQYRLLKINEIAFVQSRPGNTPNSDSYKNWKYLNYEQWISEPHSDQDYRDPGIGRRPSIDTLRTLQGSNPSYLSRRMNIAIKNFNESIWHKKTDIAIFGFNGANSLYYTTVWYNREEGVYFINFSGPQTMELPKLNNETRVISKNRNGTIIDFLENIEAWL